MPTVSIIITSFNYARFLNNAIDSALGQTFPDKEVIVVDDGSNDNSRQIISGYGKQITAVLKENAGQASAFNAGFLVSKGDIILFLDSDDALSPDAVEEVVKVWRSGMSKVHYRLQWIDAQGNLLNNHVPPVKYRLPSGDLKPTILTQGVYRTPPTSGNAFSRQFLRAVLPIPEQNWRLCPDAFLHAQAPFYGEIGANEKTLGHYRVHGSNASSLKKYNSEIERLVDEITFRQKCESLIFKSAKKIHLDATFNSTVIIAKKLALLMSCPGHSLVQKERLTKLIFSGIRAIWREKEISVSKQIVITGYFILLPFMPRSLAKQLTFWYIHPEKRPSFIKRLV
jgi:glycosyltransferase involved in cell wall biosynthesis